MLKYLIPLVPAVFLAGCNGPFLNATDALSLVQAAATVAPNLAPSASVSQVMADANVTPAARAAAENDIGKIQAAATRLCKIRPLASGVLNVGIALSSSVATLANSGVGREIRSGATIICNALTTAPTYAVLGNRSGEMITAYVSLGKFERVPIYGVRVR